MLFHWTYENSPLLFSTWVFNSPGAYALTLLICFSICLFSEFWSTYRHGLNSTNSSEQERSLLINNHNSGKKNSSLKDLYNKFLISHLWKTIVHMIAFIVNYTIMLIFMSFNGGICISCVLGIGVGFYLFGQKRFSKSVAIIEDMCH
ncbi:hypothetical protein DDB_G0285545 [Dictyostelium discoideum AX4]|uniref:Copper transport protein n=1 Tax=Dictyostelium discoideum TaxID=44689 RepID=Q54N27_DICDI|nr:hypothetical protein DDB_G0285545 [Dictyostelium discoideum AX4]EAL64610.1 hypothetical protein DDB_G0285545 [Dictyostelium discoideum AX4]|eukprot:XP_638116.1 hypothetical protein DDB_G0285545 [Dictyostelium discoideum AX4]